jgi:hypothetical protein
MQVGDIHKGVGLMHVDFAKKHARSHSHVFPCMFQWITGHGVIPKLSDGQENSLEKSWLSVIIPIK